MLFDRFKRRINYLRISVTDRCNLRCIYCMPEEGINWRKPEEIISYEEIEQVVAEGVKLGITKIRLTGGEPLVRKGIISLVERLKKIPGLEEVALTTNGILLEQYASSLREAGLDRINISLDSLRPDRYCLITRGGNLNRVLRGIEAARQAGFRRTKINMVLIPGLNTDEMDEMAEFCRRHDLILQRIHHYSLDDHETCSSHFQIERPPRCEECNRLRLTADGKLKPCLFSNIEIPIDLENVAESLKKAVKLKPYRGTKCSNRGNWEIGG